jgi:methylthioribose-1-phosphate isomerase
LSRFCGKGTVRILDEISLPEQIRYISARNVSQAINAVREMKTRAFGQVLRFLYSGALLAQNYQRKEISPMREAIDQVSQEFCPARPSSISAGLVNISRVVRKAARKHECRGVISERAYDFASQIILARGARANALPSFCMMYRLTAGL